MRKEYLAPKGMSAHALSQALRLTRYFGTDTQTWLKLQLSHVLKIAEAELKKRIEHEEVPCARHRRDFYWNLPCCFQLQ